MSPTRRSLAYLRAAACELTIQDILRSEEETA